MLHASPVSVETSEIHVLNDLRQAVATLGRAMVQVWVLAPPSSPVDEAPLTQFLDDAERGRLQQIRFPQSRYEFLAGRWLLKTVVSEYAQIDARQVRVELAPGGKPSLKLLPPSPVLYFSLSHSSGAVALALSVDADLGVDIEDSRRHICDYAQLASQFFPTNEVPWVQEISGLEGWERFLALFVQKEAWVKASGQGLSTPLSEVPSWMSPPPQSDQHRLLVQGGGGGRFFLAVESRGTVARWMVNWLDPELAGTFHAA